MSMIYSSDPELREHAILKEKASKIYKETGRPYWQVEEEVFADFWRRYPDWSPKAVSARKARWAGRDLPDFDGDTSRNGVE